MRVFFVYCSAEDTSVRRNPKDYGGGVQHSELIGLWALSTFRNSKYKKTQCFGNWNCCPPVREGDTCILQ
jgi:hypothetical protein